MARINLENRDGGRALLKLQSGRESEERYRLLISREASYVGMVEGDSTITCQYCGRKLPSREMDDHLFSEHGVTI
jgi:hypothetical protein